MRWRSTARFRRFFPAGFYYKTFIGPPGAWERLYEPAIRRAAGLGVAPTDPDPDHYAYEHRHCEVAVDRRRPGRARRRLAPPARAGGAGDPVRRAGGIRRLAARRRAGRDRRQAGGRMGRRGRRGIVGAAQRHAAAAHAGVRLLRAEFSRRRTARHRPPRLSRPETAARAVLAGARGAGDRRGRRARAPAGVPRQRPARNHAGRFRARAGGALRREARRARRRRHDPRRRLSRRARSRRRRLRNRHDRR